MFEVFCRSVSGVSAVAHGLQDVVVLGAFHQVVDGAGEHLRQEERFRISDASQARFDFGKRFPRAANR